MNPLIAVGTLSAFKDVEVITSFRVAQFESPEMAMEKARRCLNDWQRYMPDENLKIFGLEDHYYRGRGEYQVLR